MCRLIANHVTDNPNISTGTLKIGLTDVLQALHRASEIRLSNLTAPYRTDDTEMLYHRESEKVYNYDWEPDDGRLADGQMQDVCDDRKERHARPKTQSCYRGA